MAIIPKSNFKEVAEGIAKCTKASYDYIMKGFKHYADEDGDLSVERLGTFISGKQEVFHLTRKSIY